MVEAINTYEDDDSLSFLPKNGKENPFTIPDDYFNSLTASIEAGVFADGLREKISADGFGVPLNYFDSLSERINYRLPGRTSGKTVNIRWITTRWPRYAAAACFAVVASTIIFLNQKPLETVNLNSIPDEEIVNYLKVNTEADDSEMLIDNINMDKSFTNFDKGFSDQELEQYINSTTL